MTELKPYNKVGAFFRRMGFNAQQFYRRHSPFYSYHIEKIDFLDRKTGEIYWSKSAYLKEGEGLMKAFAYQKNFVVVETERGPMVALKLPDGRVVGIEVGLKNSDGKSTTFYVQSAEYGKFHPGLQEVAANASQSFVAFSNDIDCNLDGYVPKEGQKMPQFWQSELMAGVLLDIPFNFSARFGNVVVPLAVFFADKTTGWQVQPSIGPSFVFTHQSTILPEHLFLMHDLASRLRKLEARAPSMPMAEFAFVAAALGVSFESSPNQNSQNPQVRGQESLLLATSGAHGYENNVASGFAKAESGASSMKRQDFTQGFSSRRWHGEKKRNAKAATQPQGAKIKAIIFDMDGVLANSEPLHKKTFTKVFSNPKVRLSNSDWYANYSGTGSRNVVARIMDRFRLHGDIEKIVEKRKQLFQSYVDKNAVKAMPGAKALVIQARKEGLKTIVASGSHKQNVQGQLRSIGIRGMPVVAFEDAARQKPYPDLFLTAAERLGVPPSQCVVIEDSRAGVLAARAAGMKVLLVSRHQPASVKKLATKSAPTLSKSTLAWILGLAGRKKRAKTKPWHYSRPKN